MPGVKTRRSAFGIAMQVRNSLHPRPGPYHTITNPICVVVVATM